MTKTLTHPLCKMCGHRPVRNLPDAAWRPPGQPGYRYIDGYGYDPEIVLHPESGRHMKAKWDYFCSAECGARYARANIVDDMDSITYWCPTCRSWQTLDWEVRDRGEASFTSCHER